MIDNGYPHNSPTVPSAMHACLRSLDDEKCILILEFLAQRGGDINHQEPETWLTPLHLSVRYERPSESPHKDIFAGVDYIEALFFSWTEVLM
jgi:hypothetical protein